MKKSIIFALSLFFTFTFSNTIAVADKYVPAPPVEWGPWQLWKSEKGDYFYLCTYKRYQTNGRGSRLSQTEQVYHPIYKGPCPRNFTTAY